jgi:hypothetical protein
VKFAFAGIVPFFIMQLALLAMLAIQLVPPLIEMLIDAVGKFLETLDLYLLAQDGGWHDVVMLDDGGYYVPLTLVEEFLAK